ncbi:caspase-3-like isoform X2 [Mytilus californianus]|uniref:caspase-3-like isoform X2 n=1 Tax=Mytilus californianus TaxID=6549 RepID=UPI002246E31A|nr:caspase-3-like isoform X2 [Mytilus californianus]
MDGGGTDYWKTALLEVSDDLDSRDALSVRYLVQDEIGNPDFEKKRDAIDILNQLLHLKDQELVKHVGECLYLMEKFTLIRKLGLNKEELRNQVENNDTPTISPFRKALFNITKELSTDDVDKMIRLSKDFLQNLSIRRLERIDESARVFELFNILEQRKEISSEDSSFLTKLFKEMNRKDLDHHLDTLTNGGFKPVGIYPVNTESPGFCIILNNEKFEDSEKFHDRIGSQADVAFITRLFENLRYKIIVKTNLRSREIIDFVHRLKAEDHGVDTSFVFFILSHGGPRMIYGVDGVPVQLRKLTDEFTASACKSLAGKPKLFFIQACQGEKEQLMPRRTSPRRHRGVRSDVVLVSPDQDETLDDVVIPNASDFFLGFSTAPGYISYRDPSSGSFYIQSLCRQIQEKCKSHHLLDILTEVNSQVSKQNILLDGGQRAKTVPTQETSLTAKFYFYPETK